jgi:hypothetical protein
VRWPGCGQAVTYLLHFVERRLIDTRLFEVIVGSLDHLLDDQVVDVALNVAVSGFAFTVPPFACALVDH